jgi:hypothetical protein
MALEMDFPASKSLCPAPYKQQELVTISVNHPHFMKRQRQFIMDVKVQKFQVGEFDYLIQWQDFLALE